MGEQIDIDLLINKLLELPSDANLEYYIPQLESPQPNCVQSYLQRRGDSPSSGIPSSGALTP